MYSCLITDISNDTTSDMSNETTNPSTNQTNHVCEIKKTTSKRINTLLFGVVFWSRLCIALQKRVGVVGLKGLSFIILMLYVFLYTRTRETSFEQNNS